VKEHDLDPRIAGRRDSFVRLGETEVVELADRRVARGAHLGIGGAVQRANRRGSLPFHFREHQLAPGPEVAAASAPSEGTLEGVAVSVDETRQRDGLGHPANTILVLMASRAAVAAPLTYLPNALTILRLALVPLFVVVFVQADDGSSWAAGWIFLVAGITDQLDGFLARRWHVESRFGKLADPLADRLMLDAAAILLWLDDKLPWYAALIIVLRDVILVGGYRLLMPRGVELEVSKLGKAATWLLYLSLGILLVVGHSTEWPLWLFWVGFGMALVAAAQYVLEARRTVKP
jgi:cardiolipin synthase (CMP-forming)